ncbi:MAG: Peptidase family, partial [Chloroflexi bacterium]|nr:Peptidase family [Chloroflexota bacterium]
EEAHQRARDIISAHRAALDAIATTLMREESLDGERLRSIVNAVLPPGQQVAAVGSAPAEAPRAAAG